MFSMFPMLFPVFFLFNYGISQLPEKMSLPQGPPWLSAFAALARKVTSSVVPGSSDPIVISQWSVINITYNVVPLQLWPFTSYKYL